MAVNLINGILTDGKRSVDVIGAKLASHGVNIRDITLPVTRVLTAYIERHTSRMAKIVCDASADGDDAVAHSFGCEIARQSMLLGRKYNNVFLFNAACSRHCFFPYDGAKRIYNIYCPHDFILKLGVLLPGHAFGALGRNGYEGPPDSRVIDIVNDERCQWIGNHGCFAGEDSADKWSDFILQRIK